MYFFHTVCTHQQPKEISIPPHTSVNISNFVYQRLLVRLKIEKEKKNKKIKGLITLLNTEYYVENVTEIETIVYNNAYKITSNIETQ